MGLPLRLARTYGPSAAKYVAKRAARAIEGVITRKAVAGLSRRIGGRSATITTQRDAVTRTTRKGRRRVDPFIRKWRKALINEQPSLIYQAVRKSRVVVTAGLCNYTAMQLLDTQSNVDADLFNVFKDNFSAATAADVEDNALYLRSAAMTLQLKNSGSDEAFVDVYQIVAKRDVNLATAGAGNIADVYNDAFTDMVDIGSTIDNWVGMTLYDVPEFMRQFKVLKRTSLKLEVGKSASMTMASKLNTKIQGKRLVSANCALRGITRAYFIYVRGPAANDISAAGTAAATVDCSVFKTIRYAVPPTDKQSDTIGQSK